MAFEEVIKVGTDTNTGYLRATITTYDEYRPDIEFIKGYRAASNAATGSKFDSNANVEHKNITTMTGEIPKKKMIGINRLLMYDKLTEMFGSDVGDEYIAQLENHNIYKHDETSIYPYTYSSKEVVNVVYKGMSYLVSLEQLYDICGEHETLVDDEKIVYIKYPEDMVIADRNGYTKVERLIRKKRHRDLVRIKTAFGEDLIVTDNHPLIVNEDINDTVEAISSAGLQQYRCNSRAVFYGVTEIDAMDINADIISENYNSCYVVQVDTSHKRYTVPKKILLDEELGYLVGFIIGDGNYNFKNNEITDSIIVTQKDKWILEVLGDIAYRKLGAVPSITYKSDKNNCYVLRIQSPMLVSLLSKEFNIGHMAKNKCLPINIYHYNKDFAVGIVEGLIDSDGTITSNKSFQVRTSSRTLILQLSDVLRNLNFGVSNTMQDTKFGCNDDITQKYQIFGVTFSEKEGTPKLNLCIKANDSCLHDKYLKYTSDGWVNITNVEDVDNEKFLDDNEFIYDITTTSHSFICNNLWVHNCVSITMYPYLFNGMRNIGGISEPPKNLQSFCGSFINLIFAISSQFAGAVSTPEFITYMDYFIRKEYGDEYYKHSKKVVDLSRKQRTIDDVICQYWQQIVYSLNQPAAARNYQSVFWNIAYFDKPYFNGIFEDFVFPDGSEPKWESVLWLQKRFMTWFNQERLRKILTFPVETVNLLDDGEDFVDKDFADFVAEMWSKGHSFFLYRSNSVDSLASCCRLRNELQDNAFSYTLGAGGVSTGSKCVITINFNRLVQDTIKDRDNIDWETFDKAVRDKVHEVHKYLMAYNEIVKDNLNEGMLPIYDAGYISMNKQFLTIGINGLVEGAEYLGIDISPNEEYFNYCTACLKPIYEENKKAKTKDVMFNTEYVPKKVGTINSL